MLFVCFAAFNEEHNIESLMRRIAAYFGQGEAYKVVAFNDGSTDNTLGVLEGCLNKFPLIVLHSDQNKGLGEGTNRLIDYVCKHGEETDIAVFMDGDDTHDPSVITPMCAAVARGADVVIASRYCPGMVATGIPWQRILISRCASIFWRIVLPLENVKDYSCGFRAYRISALRAALTAKGGPLISRRGFECQVEILNGLRSHAVFAEVPINMAYDRKQGVSKMRLIRTTFTTLSLGIRLLTQRCLGTKSG
jgi:dolichol-phosphate mannosyltransferase